ATTRGPGNNGLLKMLLVTAHKAAKATSDSRFAPRLGKNLKSCGNTRLTPAPKVPTYWVVFDTIILAPHRKGAQVNYDKLYCNSLAKCSAPRLLAFILCSCHAARRPLSVRVRRHRPPDIAD